MKKLIFSLSLFLSFSSLVHAQWTTNGTVTSTTNSISTAGSLYLGNNNTGSTNRIYFAPGVDNTHYIYSTGTSGNNMYFGEYSGFHWINTNYNTEAMTITQAGYVGIGQSNPQNKLDVNGTVHSKAVTIDLNGWSDYVFKKDYQLRPLNEVKDYIDQNQHLPEIPSEEEMIKKGLNVGEMNKLLMKKVEELTLYIIEMKEEVKELQKQNGAIQLRIK